MATEHLRFAPEILRRLGEELVPNADQGILELVRNSYDADATECRVELHKTDMPGGTVRIIDDGDGMTGSDIHNSWLLLGRSAKSDHRPTRSGRIPSGDKGLGRLAALRLGSTVRLVTRPRREPGQEYRLTIDWKRYEEADDVESVDLNVERRVTQKKPGTTVELADLPGAFGRKEAERLARALILLSDPFDSPSGFKPTLSAPGFVDLEKRVINGYFSEAEFVLRASVDRQGKPAAHVLDRSGMVRWSLPPPDGKRVKSLYACPEVTFDLWEFKLVAEAFSAKNITKGEVQEWLDVVGGVHVYHRGLRVRPYGDRGFDWLDMNLARARSPEERPSTNNSLGRVTVPDPALRLVQKTDRGGFIENEAFVAIRAFAKDMLDWFARERVKEAEARRRKNRGTAPERARKAKAKLDSALGSLPSEQRRVIEDAVKTYEKAKREEGAAFAEDVALYRTLGTVGTTAAVFAHESAKPVTQIEKTVDAIERRVRRALGDVDYELRLREPIEMVRQQVQALRTFARFPLELLSKSKRRTREVSIHAVIRDVVSLFQPYLADAHVDVRVDLAAEADLVRTSVSAVEAVVANLITNSVRAFELGSIASDRRTIAISTQLDGGQLILVMADSGPGIIGIPVEEIWLPGRTTAPDGTGLGLTIVRDSVQDMRGEIEVEANGPINGASFVVRLPLMEPTRC